VSEFTELKTRLAHMVTPGLVVGTLLAVFAPHFDGVKEAAKDLYKHAVYIHPFLIALAGFFVTACFALQNATVSRRLEPFLLAPILAFMSHLFAAGSGAYIPLYFAVNGIPQCEGVAAIASTLIALLALAVASAATLILLERRMEARSVRVMGANGRPGDASENQAALFLVLAIVCAVFVAITATLDNPTEKLIKAAQMEVSSRICH
jgi:hypothetical protein